MVRTLCSHWWRSHWFPGLPETEAGAALSAGRGGERRTDTGCLACRPRSASAGRRRSSTRTWWPPARASAAGPGRGRTHAQRPGEGPCLQGEGEKMSNRSWRRWWSGVCLEAGTDFCFLIFPLVCFSFGWPFQLSHKESLGWTWKAALVEVTVSATHSPMWFPRVHDSS